MAVALSGALDERKAAFPAARNGISAVAGLARRAIEAADLVVDSMLATDTRKWRLVKEWRGETWGGGRATLP